MLLIIIGCMLFKLISNKTAKDKEILMQKFKDEKYSDQADLVFKSYAERIPEIIKITILARLTICTKIL